MSPHLDVDRLVGDRAHRGGRASDVRQDFGAASAAYIVVVDIEWHHVTPWVCSIDAFRKVPLTHVDGPGSGARHLEREVGYGAFFGVFDVFSPGTRKVRVRIVCQLPKVGFIELVWKRCKVRDGGALRLSFVR